MKRSTRKTQVADSPEGAAWAALGLQDDTTVRFAMDQLVRAALGVVGADQGALLLAEPGRGALRFAMVVDAASAAGAGRPSAAALVGSTVPFGEGVTGMAALTRDVQSAAVVRDGEAPFRRVRGDGAPGAVLAAPVLDGDELLGVLTAVSFRRRRTFSREESALYGVFANVAAVVVGQRRRLELVAAGPAGLAGRASPAVPGPEREERALVEEVLSFVRSRPGRAAALRGLLSSLAAFP